MDESRFDPRSFAVGALLTTAILGAVYWFVLREPPRRRDRAKGPFGEGRVLVMSGRYAEAVPRLEVYLDSFAAGRNRSRAGLFLGKAHLGRGEFELARAAFTETAERYPETLEAHKCRYKLCLLDLLEGDRASAAAGFRALAEDPDGSLAPEADALWRYLDAEPPAADR